MAKAPAADQLRLLEVQGLDTRLDQIAHSRTSHPTVARLGELDSQLADLNTTLVASRTAVGDLKRELAKAEADVEQVRARAERNERTLATGTVSAKDAQALVSESESLARRQGVLEEAQLEVMERLEAHEDALAKVDAAYAELVAARAAVQREQDEAFRDLDAEVARVTEDRQARAEGLGEELIAVYDRLRGRLGGVAVAALRHRRSEGSGMAVSPSELNRIKALPEDEIVFCEDSGRILVRGDDAF